MSKILFKKKKRKLVYTFIVLQNRGNDIYLIVLCFVKYINPKFKKYYLF